MDIFESRMNELYRLVKYHAGLYYDKDSPEISDAEYDALRSELLELELMHPQYARKDSPTQTVGGQPSELFAKVEHDTPMLSLDNVFKIEPGMTPKTKQISQKKTDSLVGFFSSVDCREGFICEMKIDGLAVSLVYEDGIFVRGATRGNGIIGEDVTENLMLVDSVPKKLTDAPSGRVEVRGEVLMTRERFNAVNALLESRGKKTFVNPRNAAAGLLRNKENHDLIAMSLDIFLYYLVDAERLGVLTQADALSWLKEHGLPVQDAFAVCDDMAGVKEFIYRWQNDRYKLNYHTDGVVVKVNDLSSWTKLGATSHAPRWAAAYKYPPEEARTRVIDITISVGRTGALTPVAILEPVIVAGTTVQRATLHNADYIKHKDIRIGDWVYISKAGEIIPQIDRVDISARKENLPPFVMPDKCPVCSADVIQKPRAIINRNYTLTEAAHVCTNPHCQAKLREAIRHFVSRKAMDIRGIGKVLAYSLVDTGKVHSLADIYRLTPEDWHEAGLGDKVTQKVMNEIESSKSRPLSAFVTGLGIPNIERINAEALAEYFGSIEALEAASVLEIMKAMNPAVQDTAEKVYAFFRDDGNVSEIEQKFSGTIKSLAEALRVTADINSPSAGKIAGYFGTVEAIKKASQEAIIEALIPEAESFTRIAKAVYEFLRDDNNAESITPKKDSQSEFVRTLCEIPGVERGAAMKLAKFFGNIATLRAATQEDIFAVLKPKAEVIIANSVHEFFRDAGNIDLVNEFRAIGVNMLASGTDRALSPSSTRKRMPTQPTEIQEDRFKGKIFVFTGTLSTMARNEAGEKVMQLGGLFSNSVTLKTSYLVVGEKPGSKLRKAESLGVKIITEQEFLSLIENHA